MVIVDTEESRFWMLGANKVVKFDASLLMISSSATDVFLVNQRRRAADTDSTTQTLILITLL